MAAASEDRYARKGTWQPYALISPGVLWLILFFVVPVATMLQIALSRQEGSRFDPSYRFDWNFSNFTDAWDEFSVFFLRSFLWAAIATLLCIAIGYPMAYFIAFRGGKYRNLLLGLVVIPFFTSYLIRTIAWQTFMGDNGPIVGVLERLHLTGITDWLTITFNGRLMATRTAVIGGLTYNFLPFMILPIYVSLERIDVRLVDAAKDLYSNGVRAFYKVVLPLSLPGVFAGTLLTFIPATGDFVNSLFLGSANDTMIGSKVQALFLEENRYTIAAAIALILMAVITLATMLYSWLLGTEDLVG
jgi:spermidine/putrescine transport system permease protein